MCEGDWLAGGIKTRKLTTLEEFSKVGLNIENYPTGVAYYRDATNVKQDVDPKDPLDPRNPFMLRSLNMVRGIDHAFEQLAEKTKETRGEDYYKGLRRCLASFYGENLKKYEADSQEYSLAEIEERFNSALAGFLQRGSLDQGITDNFKKSYQELLLNYRLLASTIEPAAAMVTKFKSHLPEDDTTFTEIAWPVTKKTEAQKAELAKMKKDSTSKNYHNSQPWAIQLAQTLFADRISDDKTIMSSLLRNTIAPGVKNAYITQLVVNISGDSKEYSFGRSGSLVYMGKGEKASLEKHTNENVNQIRQAAIEHGVAEANVKLHSTVLNTNTVYKHDDHIVQGTQAALTKNEDLFSNVAVNVLGTCYPTILAPSVRDEIKKETPKVSKGWGRKSERASFAGTVAFLASKIGGVFSIFSCASGQDRTGVADEIVKALCIQDAYKDHERCKNLSFEDAFKDALNLKMQGLSTPFLATLASPGSRGIKSESKPGKLFDAYSKKLFLSTANTNKRVPLDASSVEYIAAHAPRFFSLSNNKGVISFNLLAPDVVLGSLHAYLDNATGFGSGFMRNKVLLDHKVRETSKTMRELLPNSEALKTLTLETLKQKLEELQNSIVKKTKEINKTSFFKHGPGRLDEIIARCLGYISQSEVGYSSQRLVYTNRN